MQNSEIAKILLEVGEYLEMDKASFQSRAYKRAASTIFNLEEKLQDIYEQGGLDGLKNISGIGPSISLKIEELLKTGHLKYYESFKDAVPIKIDELTRIEGIGIKKIKTLYKKLGIKNIDDLEKAARSGKIRKIEGFGSRSEENILKGIEFQRKNAGRFTLGSITPIAEDIAERLRGVSGVSKVVITGSYRRRKETIGDLDFLVVSKSGKKLMDYIVSQPEVERVLANGPTKSSVRLRSGIDVDVRVVPPESYGAALAYFTGSKSHNVSMRLIAQRKGLKLNEYGLFRGNKRIAGSSEKEIYELLGMDYVFPEMREDLGEIELAKRKKLPNLIKYGSLKGDLQTQSTWTDGSNSIEELARAAIDRGLEYIAITDHTKNLAMTHGLDEKRIRKQMTEIDNLNKKLKGKIVVLKGTECDILKDGTLDLPDNILRDLDIVGVAVHTYFNLPRKEQMERIKRAIKNPNVDILFHPTGRIINRRAAEDIDIDKLIDIAKITGTILEIDAFPDRLDLKDEYIRKCVNVGVKMSIDSDAHSTNHFGYLDFGIAQARRGWAERKDIINAWPLNKCLEFTKHG